MKFIDAFGGIGGFRKGLERWGHECAGYIDNNKYAGVPVIEAIAEGLI